MKPANLVLSRLTQGRTEGVAPLERLVPPAHLDGTEGVFRVRERQCVIDAKDDLEAVRLWVQSMTGRVADICRLRSAGERLLNWCCFQRHLALSSLREKDIIEFSNFLLDPTPSDRWIAPKGTRRESADWRPFNQPLSLATRDLVMSGVRCLLHWLVQQDYAFIPLHGSRHKSFDGTRARGYPAYRPQGAHVDAIGLDEWRWIRQALESVDELDSELETRLIVELMYYGALSAKQISALKLSSIARSASHGCWFIWTQSAPRRREVPPPLEISLVAWMKRLNEQLLRSDDSAALLPPAKLSSYRVRVVAVMRRGAAMARSAASVDAASRLERRTTRALKNAFQEHTHLNGAEADAMQHLWTTDPATARRRQWRHWEHVWAPLQAATPKKSTRKRNLL